MHIPDGMLDTGTWVTTWVGSAGFLGFAVREVRRRLSDAKIVLMAVLAALIFALQMLNFPVAGGTSGHFAGGAAAAIVLGPWPAALVMTAVLAVQAVFFGDGGITALGANILDMAVIGPMTGWWVYSVVRRLGTSRAATLAGASVAAWIGCVCAAVGAALLLWISGRAPLLPVLGAMALWHALIGIGEALVTAGLVGYLLAVRPDLLAQNRGDDRSPAGLKTVLVTLGALAFVAVALSFLASRRPDGLEYVYRRTGHPFGEVAVLESPLPDYVLPGITNEALAGILAGAVGVIVTGVLLYGGVRALKARRRAVS